MFQSRCRDSLGCDQKPMRFCRLAVRFQSRCRDSLGCDVKTPSMIQAIRNVSVPLPGFIGLRHVRVPEDIKDDVEGFSPVAGIHWAATRRLCQDGGIIQIPGFSPVAGIHWAATTVQNKLKSLQKIVSVPLPGFIGLRPDFRAWSNAN